MYFFQKVVFIAYKNQTSELKLTQRESMKNFEAPAWNSASKCKHYTKMQKWVRYYTLIENFPGIKRFRYYVISLVRFTEKKLRKLYW